MWPYKINTVRCDMYVLITFGRKKDKLLGTAVKNIA